VHDKETKKFLARLDAAVEEFQRSVSEELPALDRDNFLLGLVEIRAAFEGDGLSEEEIRQQIEEHIQKHAPPGFKIIESEDL
jgi:hypothetical protein